MHQTAMTGTSAHCKVYVDICYHLFDTPKSEQRHVNSSCRNSCSEQVGVRLVYRGGTGAAPHFVTTQSEETVVSLDRTWLILREEE